jgi:uncharacterized protein YndB with AHSA1/START domain
MELQEQCGAVVRERVLAAGRDVAWEHLASPEGLEGWLADEVDLADVAPGAEGTLRWADGQVRDVVVEEVSEGRRLAMRWEDRDGAPATLVELTLDDHEDGTILRVVELPLVTLHAVGAALPALARRASGRQSGRGPLALAA